MSGNSKQLVSVPHPVLSAATADNMHTEPVIDGVSNRRMEIIQPQGTVNNQGAQFSWQPPANCAMDKQVNAVVTVRLKCKAAFLADPDTPNFAKDASGTGTTSGTVSSDEAIGFVDKTYTTKERKRQDGPRPSQGRNFNMVFDNKDGELTMAKTKTTGNTNGEKLGQILAGEHVWPISKLGTIYNDSSDGPTHLGSTRIYSKSTCPIASRRDTFTQGTVCNFTGNPLLPHDMMVEQDKFSQEAVSSSSAASVSAWQAPTDVPYTSSDAVCAESVTESATVVGSTVAGPLAQAVPLFGSLIGKGKPLKHTAASMEKWNARRFLGLASPNVGAPTTIYGTQDPSLPDVVCGGGGGAGAAATDQYLRIGESQGDSASGYTDYRFHTQPAEIVTPDFTLKAGEADKSDDFKFGDDSYGKAPYFWNTAGNSTLKEANELGLPVNGIQTYLRDYPLTRLIRQTNLTINGGTMTHETADLAQGSLRVNRDPTQVAQCYPNCPTMLDTKSCPLNNSGLGVLKSGQACFAGLAPTQEGLLSGRIEQFPGASNGTLKDDGTKQDQGFVFKDGVTKCGPSCDTVVDDRYIDISFTQPLDHPVFSAGTETCLMNTSQIDLTLNFNNPLSMFRNLNGYEENGLMANAMIQSGPGWLLKDRGEGLGKSTQTLASTLSGDCAVEVEITGMHLEVIYYSLMMPAPPVWMDHYKQPTHFRKDMGLVGTAGPGKTTQFDAIRLGTVPEYIMIYATPNLNEYEKPRGIVQQNFPLPIKSVKFTINNESGILSDSSATDLWSISKSNGVDATCHDWVQEGGVLYIRLGKDICVPKLYPGAHSTFNCAVDVEFGGHKNILGEDPSNSTEARRGTGIDLPTDSKNSSWSVDPSLTGSSGVADEKTYDVGKVNYQAHCVFLTSATLELSPNAMNVSSGYPGSAISDALAAPSSGQLWSDFSSTGKASYSAMQGGSTGGGIFDWVSDIPIVGPAVSSIAHTGIDALAGVAHDTLGSGVTSHVGSGAPPSRRNAFK